MLALTTAIPIRTEAIRRRMRFRVEYTGIQFFTNGTIVGSARLNHFIGSSAKLLGLNRKPSRQGNSRFDLCDLSEESNKWFVYVWVQPRELILSDELFYFTDRRQFCFNDFLRFARNH